MKSCQLAFCSRKFTYFTERSQTCSLPLLYPVLSQINLLYIFQENLRSIGQSTYAFPMDTLGFEQNFLMLFLQHSRHCLVPTRYTIHKNIWLSVPFLATAFTERSHHQAEERYDTSYFFTKSLLLRARQPCYLQQIQLFLVNKSQSSMQFFLD
jgi:hypothetical protein